MALIEWEAISGAEPYFFLDASRSPILRLLSYLEDEEIDVVVLDVHAIHECLKGEFNLQGIEGRQLALWAANAYQSWLEPELLPEPVQQEFKATSTTVHFSMAGRWQDTPYTGRDWRPHRTIEVRFASYGGQPIHLLIGDYDIEIDDDLIAVSDRLEVREHISTAAQLATACFPDLRDPSLQHEVDPEIDDEWLSLRICISGETEEILRRLREYTTRWIRAVPWPQSDRIRLIYDVR